MLFRTPIKASIIILSLALTLTGCGFLGTTKDDMEGVEENTNTGSVTSGSYEKYTPERFDELLGTEKFALFFHADWCPTCRALEKEIKENLDELNSRTVLEVNYDTETDLKKEYEVMVQSTVVFINANGSVFEKRLNPDFELIKKFFY